LQDARETIEVINMPIQSRPGFTPPGFSPPPTPMPAAYSVPIGESIMDVNKPVSQTVQPQPQVQPVMTQGLPDNFFGFLMLMMGL